MHDAPTRTVDVAGVVARADELEAEGRFLDAAAALAAIPMGDRPGLVDVRIVHLRHLAFAEVRHDPLVTRTAADGSRFAGVVGPPEVARADATPAILRSALESHGVLLVRGLLDEQVAADMRANIDAAFEAMERRCNGATFAETAPWYHPMKPAYGSEELDPFAEVFLYSCGGIYGGCSPRSYLDYLQRLEDAGAIDLVRAELGQRPVLSLNKTVLRRLHGGARPSWHQDASYLGSDIRALNLWMSLSHCGGDTDIMGLEILPKRLTEVAEMGTYNAEHADAIAEQVVDRLGGETRPVRPEFFPGDALLFDHFFIHRSDTRPLPTDRYAIESWFFTASGYPSNQVPIVVA